MSNSAEGSATISKEVITDPSAPVHVHVDTIDHIREKARLLFNQYSGANQAHAKFQLDEVDGNTALTSFLFPTLQFIFTPKHPEHIFVSNFPADDATASIGAVIDMQKRAHQYGFTLELGGLIAPVRQGQGIQLVSDPAEVYVHSAKHAIRRGRDALKALNMDDNIPATTIPEAASTQTEGTAQAPAVEAKTEEPKTKGKQKDPAAA